MSIGAILIIGLYVTLTISIVCNCITKCKELEVSGNTIEDRDPQCEVEEPTWEREN